MSVATRINEGAAAAFGADGRAVVRLGPGRAGVTWRITAYALSTSEPLPVSVPAVRVYIGEPSPGNEIDSSYNGHRNSASDQNIILASGQYLTAEWTGGTPGVVATLSAFGERI